MSAWSCRSPIGLGLDEQLQSRLQAQAVPPGCGRTARDPTRHVAGVVHASGAERAARPRSAGPFDEQRQAHGVGANRRSGQPSRLPLRVHVPTGRHPVQGRSSEHGALARGPCPVPRRRARRVPGTPPQGSRCVGSIRSTSSSGRWRTGSPAESRTAPRRGSAFQSPNGSRESCAHRCRKTRNRPDQPSGHLRRDDRNASRLEHLSGRRDHRKQLWTLFVFQLWHRRWVENNAPGTGAPLGGATSAIAQAPA